MNEIPMILAAILTAWILIGWISGTILTIWDYNDGEPITIKDFLLVIFAGGFGGILVLLFMMSQFPREFKKTKLSKRINKPIWQKKFEEK